MARRNADPDDITAWQRLSAAVTTSGRLETGDAARLAAIGVRHVINLALADSPGALADEAALLAAQGMGYTHIPVPFDAPGEAHYAAFCTALDDAQRPIHVHCIANWRVSAFFYRYHRDVLGMDEGQARALMEQQWCPDSHDHPAAPQWARLIGLTRP